MKTNFINTMIIITVMFATAACKEDASISDYMNSDATTAVESMGRPTRRVRAYDDFLKRTGKKVNAIPKKNSFDLIRVYDELRDNFTYMRDMEQYGVEEYWTVMSDDDPVGDCEDFALTLRARLIADGFSPVNVRIATCYVPTSYTKSDDPEKRLNHAVLIVEINNGQVYVVDNGDHYKFHEFEVINWDRMLDETGNYWVNMNVSS